MSNFIAKNNKVTIEERKKLQPSEKIQIGVDFTALILLGDTFSITSIDGDGATISGETISANIVEFWIENCTDNKNHNVVITLAQDGSDQIVVRNLIVVCRDR